MGATHASNASVFLVSDQRGDLASYASSAVVNIGAYQGPGVAGTVADLSPNTGPAAGGTSVILTGTGFLGTTAVQFGGTAATSFTVNSATQITATAPPARASLTRPSLRLPGTLPFRIRTSSRTLLPLRLRA